MSINKVCVFSVCIALALSACSSNKEWFTDHNGNMPSEDRIAKLKVGQYKEDVFANLGTPSSIVSLDQNTWIYMSADVERVAFFKPEEVDRDILIIRFNDENKVAEIKRMNQKDGQEVKVSEEQTSTLGEKPGFFERFFGGVGSYSPFMGKTQNPNM